MVLRPSPVDLDRFTLHEATLVAEISDFGPGFDFGRVYDDASDAGLTVVSRVGEEVVYAMHHEQRDSDDDVQYWDLVPVYGSDRTKTLRIFND